MQRIARAATAAVVLATGAAGVAGCEATGAANAASRPAGLPASRLATSIADAYSFLNQMMDKYAAGTTTRLVQSFTGGFLGSQRFTASETYDDAVLIDAYLAAGNSGARSRAEVIGNGLLYAQANDPLKDGRIRAAYAPTPWRGHAAVVADSTAVPTGDLAWAGLALVQLYAATGKRAYLHGAEAIGDWVQVNCFDTRGAGGYTGGETASGQEVAWKSTEHNIDLYGLFHLLAVVTGDPVWSARAAWARRFVAAMWDQPQGRFDIGTLNDGTTTNDGYSPEDINSWSYLAFRDPVFEGSVDWDVRNLAVTAHGFSGVSFCRADRTGVWLEGTAHLADALALTGNPRDRTLAVRYLSDIYHAQKRGPNNDGLGIISASRDGLSDCSGGLYYSSLHTGATAWYILAADQINPFALIQVSSTAAASNSQNARSAASLPVPSPR